MRFQGNVIENIQLAMALGKQDIAEKNEYRKSASLHCACFQ
jgi:hypothetical protein